MDEQRQDDQFEQQLCTDSGDSSEDLPEAKDDREVGREKVKDIHPDGAT